MYNSKAFVFPGQGSQSVGMLTDIAEKHPEVINLYKEASQILGYDLWAIVISGPEEKLNQTEFTQPALLVADVALWRIWCKQNKSRPSYFAGHSLGEFSALVCADAIVFDDAVNLVATRGRLMQKAVPEGKGAMAAIIGLDNDVVKVLCEKASEGEICAPANYNSVGQVVIAGAAAAVDRAVALAKPAGAKIAKRIPVSVPSHCALMQSAADGLAKVLADVKIMAPLIPVIQNVDAQAHDDVDIIRKNLIAQLTEPVLWVQTIQKMQSLGVSEITECGPGRVLSGLIKRISRDIIVQPIAV